MHFACIVKYPILFFSYQIRPKNILLSKTYFFCLLHLVIMQETFSKLSMEAPLQMMK